MTDPGRDSDVAEPMSYCLVEGIDALDQPAWGGQPPPWAPGRREEATHVERMAAFQDHTWRLTEVDIFATCHRQRWTPSPTQRQ